MLLLLGKAQGGSHATMYVCIISLLIPINQPYTPSPLAHQMCNCSTMPHAHTIATAMQRVWSMILPSKLRSVTYIYRHTIIHIYVNTYLHEVGT